MTTAQQAIAIQNLLVRRPNTEYLAGMLLPVIQTAKMNAVYYKYDTNFELGRNTDTLRAPGTDPKSAFIGDPVPVSVTIRGHALSHKIPNENRLNDAGILNENQVARDLRDRLFMAREQAFITNTKAALVAAGYTTDVTANSGIAWNAPNSIPVTTIKAAIANIETNAGVTPNVLCLSRKAADAIVLSSQFVGITAQTRDPRTVYAGKEVMQQAIADLLGIERVLIGSGSVSGAKNTAGRDKAPVATSLWGSDALLAYYGPQSLNSQSLGYQFLLTGAAPLGGSDTGAMAQDGIMVARDDKGLALATELAVYHYRHDEVAANPAAGWWFTNVVS